MKFIDLFPKVDRTYKKETVHGGAVTVTVSSLLICLFIIEVFQFMKIQHSYNFTVDNDIDAKLNINLDISVAMDCNYLSIDIHDTSGAALNLRQNFRLEPDFIEISDLYALSYQHNQSLYSLYSSQHGKNDVNIQKLIHTARSKSGDWKSWLHTLGLGRVDTIRGCRIHGAASVNKVNGHMHISALGHGHLGVHTPHNQLNFSHIIRRLQFGKDYPGIENPLDFSANLADKIFASFKYFINVVPTTYTDHHNNVLITNQYAVTEFQRQWQAERLTAASTPPGIFFQYSIESISVEIRENKESFLRFLIRIGAIFGGIWYLAAAINSVIDYWNVYKLSKLIQALRRQSEYKMVPGSKPGSPINEDMLESPPISPLEGDKHID